MNPYSKSYYKAYILVPIILAIASLLALPSLHMGVDLKGGTSISALVDKSVNVSPAEMKTSLSDLGLQDLRISVADDPVSNKKMYIIEFANFNQQLNKTGVMNKVLEKISNALRVKEEQLNVQQIGPAIGKSFWESSIRALILAFIFMGIVVFITFREIAPSTYVISAAVLDIMYALLGLAIFGIPLSLATVAALLMIIGYSVDTDILLTNRVLKRREGTVNDRIMSAMKTGLTMSGTTIGALLVLVLASWILHVQTLLFIGATLTFGLLGDLVSTWMMNAVILKWWVERKS